MGRDQVLERLRRKIRERDESQRGEGQRGESQHGEHPLRKGVNFTVCSNMPEKWFFKEMLKHMEGYQFKDMKLLEDLAGQEDQDIVPPYNMGLIDLVAGICSDEADDMRVHFVLTEETVHKKTCVNIMRYLWLAKKSGIVPDLNWTCGAVASTGDMFQVIITIHSRENVRVITVESDLMIFAKMYGKAYAEDHADFTKTL